MTKKISQLPAATSVDTNDEFVINQDGTTKKLTTANQWDFDNVNIDGGTIDGTAVNATNLAYTGTLTGGTGVVNLGSGQVYKDANGNVGIGTTSPADKVDIDIAAATPTNSNALGFSIGPRSGSTAVGEGVGIGFRVRNTVGGNVGGNGFGAAIYGIQTAAAANTGGLALYTRPSVAAFTEAMRIDSSGNVKFNSGFGSVGTVYGCRAWVNFNGAGTVAIREDGNVSSITDNGTGDYTVNFTTAMPDVNYGTAGSVGRSFASTDGIGRDICVDRYATGSVGIRCGDSSSFSAEDPPVICLSIFR